MAVGRHRQMLPRMSVTAGDDPHGAVLRGRFVDREPHRDEPSFYSPKVGLLMPGNLKTVRRLFEELCPEQHHIVTEDLGDGADYLRKSTQLINQSAVKVSIKREALFRGKRLMAGRSRWMREDIPQGVSNRPCALGRVELKVREQAIALESLQFQLAQRPRRDAVLGALHVRQCSCCSAGERRGRTIRLS